MDFYKLQFNFENLIWKFILETQWIKFKFRQNDWKIIKICKIVYVNTNVGLLGVAQITNWVEY